MEDNTAYTQRASVKEPTSDLRWIVHVTRAKQSTWGVMKKDDVYNVRARVFGMYFAIWSP